MGAPLQTLPRATADVGLKFIERYARASVKNEFRSRALPAGFEADDLVAGFTSHSVRPSALTIPNGSGKPC